MKKAYTYGAAGLHVRTAAASLIVAISIILLGFFSVNVAPRITGVVWYVGLELVALSDKPCPPSATRCVFGADSQGSHHLWFFICLLAGWWAIAAWFVRLIARRVGPGTVAR